jgi:hypothetical protein
MGMGSNCVWAYILGPHARGAHQHAARPPASGGVVSPVMYQGERPRSTRSPNMTEHSRSHTRITHEDIRKVRQELFGDDFLTESQPPLPVYISTTHVIVAPTAPTGEDEDG